MEEAYNNAIEMKDEELISLFKSQGVNFPMLDLKRAIDEGRENLFISLLGDCLEDCPEKLDVKKLLHNIIVAKRWTIMEILLDHRRSLVTPTKTPTSISYDDALLVACDCKNLDMVKLFVFKGATNISEALERMIRRDNLYDDRMQIIIYLLKLGAKTDFNKLFILVAIEHFSSYITSLKREILELCVGNCDRKMLRGEIEKSNLSDRQKEDRYKFLGE